MAPPPLTIVFKPAERHGSGPAVLGLIGGLVEGLVNYGSGGTVGGGGAPAGTIKQYPEVAVYNAAGDRHVLEVADSDEEAEARARAIEEDLQTLDIATWCDRYDVPRSFVDESG